MTDVKNSSTNWITIVTAILSVASAIGVAYFGFKSSSMQTQINASLKSEEIVLERNKFEDDQRERRDKLVGESIPKLLGSNASDRQIALAMIFALYPNEASAILEAVNRAQNEKSVTDLQTSITKAVELNKSIGEWLIVMGSDISLEQAMPELQKAKGQNFSATIYHRGTWYVTTIGPFPSEVDAGSANIAVRSKLGGDSFIVNFRRWCPNPSKRDGYFECG